jgi:predicted dehydrogenase
LSGLRLGIVGFGRLARECYVPALRRLREAKLEAIADPLSESQREARATGARVYDTPEQLFANARLDGVLIASPPSTHLAAWRAARAAGIAVFMEKPLVLSAQLASLDASDVDPRLMIDFNRRFWPPYARARSLVSAGFGGRPATLRFQLHLDVLGWSTVTRHRLAASEGGVIHDLGSHAIDLATWILDEQPEHLAAAATSTSATHERVRLELRFPSGAVAHADLAYGERTRERLTIEGPAGRIRLAEPNLALHVERAGAKPSALVEHGRDAAVLAYRALRPSARAGRGSIGAALSAFTQAMAGERAFDPGVADALANARLVADAVRFLGKTFTR